ARWLASPEDFEGRNSSRSCATRLIAWCSSRLVTLTASPAALAGNSTKSVGDLYIVGGRASLSNSYALRCTLPIPNRRRIGIFQRRIRSLCRRPIFLRNPYNASLFLVSLFYGVSSISWLWSHVFQKAIHAGRVP